MADNKACDTWRAIGEKVANIGEQATTPAAREVTQDIPKTADATRMTTTEKKAIATEKLEQKKAKTFKKVSSTGGEPIEPPKRTITGSGSTPNDRGKSILDQILDPIREQVNTQRIAATEMNDVLQAAATKKLNKIKTATDPSSPYAEFMYYMNDGYVRTYVRNLDTSEFAEIRDFVRDRLAGTGVTGDAARIIENTYKTERLGKIQAKLQHATTMEGTNLKQEIDTILSEGILIRADISNLDHWEMIADNDVRLMSMLNDRPIYDIMKKKLGRHPVTTEDLEKAQEIFTNTQATKQMLETTIAKAADRPGLEKTAEQAERLLANLDPKDKQIANNLLDSTGVLTKEEENLAKAATLKDDEFVPPATQRKLSDQLINKKINGETVATAEREAKYVKTYDYTTLSEKNAVAEFDRIKTDKLGGRDVADAVIKRKAENNLAEVDKIASEKGSKFWRNLPNDDETKFMDDITAGKQITPENIEQLGKLLDKVSVEGWSKIRNAVSPINALKTEDAMRIVTQSRWRSYTKTGLKWGTVLGLTLPMLGYMYATAGLQQIFENMFGYSSITQDKLTIEQLKAAFLKDLDPTSKATMELIMNILDKNKEVYEFILSIPYYGTWFNMMGGGAGYAIILSFGKEMRLKDIGVALDAKGLIVWDDKDRRGWRAKTDIELEADYLNNPYNLLKSKDRAWIEKWGDKIFGTEPTGVIDPATGKELTPQQAAILYYRIKNDKTIGTLDDLTTANLSGIGLEVLQKYIGQEGKSTREDILKWGDTHLNKPTTPAGTRTPTTVKYSDAQKAALKNMGLDDAQIAENEKIGSTMTQDPVTGRWTYTKGTGAGSPTPTGGGGGGGGSTTVATGDPYVEKIKEKMKTENYVPSYQELRDINTEAAQRDTYVKEMLDTGQSMSDIKGQDESRFKEKLKPYIAQGVQDKTITRQDIDNAATVDKPTTQRALYEAYCEGA